MKWLMTKALLKFCTTSHLFVLGLWFYLKNERMKKHALMRKLEKKQENNIDFRKKVCVGA